LPVADIPEQWVMRRFSDRQPTTWMRTVVRIRLFVGVVLMAHASVIWAQDPVHALEDSLVKLIERAEPSVVSIARIRPAPFEAAEFRPGPFNRIRHFQNGPFHSENAPPTDPEHPDYQPNEFGAGVVISTGRGDDRLVLTNYHVVLGGPVSPEFAAEDGTRLFIRFADRRSCDATIIAADPRSDLAVLRLDLHSAEIDPKDVKPLEWSAPTTSIRKGQLVVMLGNPHALARDGSASASWGMVSNLARRPLPWTSDRNSKVMLYRLGNLVQIDGRLNLGTSGGPVLNLKGELIGLTTSLAAVEGFEKSAGFAIPFDESTRRVVKSLAAGQEVEYGMLGVSPSDVTPTAFRHLQTGVHQASAAEVQEITPDSPAARAGIMPGDILLSAAGETILSEYDLMRIVGLRAPETEVDVVAWRRGRSQPFTVRVKLGKWPVRDDERIIETSPRFAPWRGLSVDYPTGRDKYMKDGPPFRRAVVITKVAADTPAFVAGLQPGIFVTEVNRIPVQTPGEFHDAVKLSRGSVNLKLLEGRTVVVGE
jgi:serine protease Do